MTLVPRDEIVRAEVWVKNDDIGFVRERQPAKINLAAFTFQKCGMLDGEVAHVSADAAAPQPVGAATPAKVAEPPAYRALLDLRTQVLEADDARYRVAPGMQVSAEIHLGPSTILESLVSPVQKAFREAASERLGALSARDRAA